MHLTQTAANGRRSIVEWCGLASGVPGNSIRGATRLLNNPDGLFGRAYRYELRRTGLVTKDNNPVMAAIEICQRSMAVKGLLTAITWHRLLISHDRFPRCPDTPCTGL